MVQSTVSNTALATGIPGEFSRSTNQDSFGAILNSGTESLNVASSVVLHVADNDYEVGVAADGNPAGILGFPKIAVRDTLDAQAYFSNDTQVEIATRGYLFATINSAAEIGDYVYYSDTDGTLQTGAPADTAPTGYTRLPGGKVTGINPTEAGVAEIYFDMLAGSTETPA